MDSAHRWDETWVEAQAGQAGGQAISKIVTKRSSGDEQLYFLKILSKQNDMERRKRMYREVTAYNTLEHPGVPRLIESNTEQFADPSYKLYLVTEYIPGTNLYDFVCNDGPLSVENAIRLVLEITRILIYCHSEDCVHRDIKPDNIMLRNNQTNDPVVVDFGLSFNGSDEADLRTDAGQELGNRFLRLPELGIDSSNKRDRRSDIASICGIFLYALTGEQPVTLLDEESRLPHQRPHISTKIANLPVNTNLLRQIFDQGFQPNINNRWPRAEDLQAALKALMNQSPQQIESTNSETILQDVLASLGSASLQVSVRHRQILAASIRSAREEAQKIIGRLTPAFTGFQTGYSIDVQNLTARDTYGAKRLMGQQKLLSNSRCLSLDRKLLQNARLERIPLNCTGLMLPTRVLMILTKKGYDILSLARFNEHL